MKKYDKKVRILAGLCGVAAVIICAYAAAGLYYNTHFFPCTSVNSTDISGMTLDGARAAIQEESEHYALHIHTRGNQEEMIYGTEFALLYEYDDNVLAEFLKSQKFWEWGLHIFEASKYEMPVLAAYDDKKLEELISALPCLDSQNMIKPENAYLSYDAEQGFHIVPEVNGSIVRAGDFKKQVQKAVENAVTDLSLEELNLYEEPEIRQDNEELNAEYNLLAPYLKTKIVYRFGDTSETLDAGTFYEWISVDERKTVSVDEEKIKEYVKNMAREYNTAYSQRTLETSYGETVTISTGPYGWLINQPEEVTVLKEALLSCESQDREPVYYTTAASHNEPDYGDTYVEINLSAQHLFFYKEGKLIIESDFVSGNESRGMATPEGIFPLTYKERNATLKGQGYASPVSYWMPFNQNIGMHDSSWRKSYGKDIYKKNGSHGCINLPPEAAKVIYENIEQGMPILCYYLSGTAYQEETILENEEISNIIEAEPLDIPETEWPDSMLQQEIPPEGVVPEPVLPDGGVPEPVLPDGVTPEPISPDEITLLPVIPEAVPGET